jgi:hypothetical protein
VIQSLADKINAADAAKKLARAWFVEQLTVKRALAPALWDALKRALEAKDEFIKVNTGHRIIVETMNSLAVKIRNADTGKLVSLRYDADTPCLWFESSERNGYLAFKLNDDATDIKFFDPKREVAIFTDEVAEFFFGLVA